MPSSSKKKSSKTPSSKSDVNHRDSDCSSKNPPSPEEEEQIPLSSSLVPVEKKKKKRKREKIDNDNDCPGDKSTGTEIRSDKMEGFSSEVEVLTLPDVGNDQQDNLMQAEAKEEYVGTVLAENKKKKKRRKREKIANDYNCSEEKSTDTEMRSHKKVGLSGEAEVFTVPDVGNDQEDNLVQGETKEEYVCTVEDENKNKKKKRKTEKINNDYDCSQEKSPDKEMGSNKKVRFSGEVEVFTLPDVGNDQEDNLLQGKRFTKEEDEIVKEAVHKYVADHALGEDGLSMVLNSSKHPKLKGCWKEIGAVAIPYRPFRAVYHRAQVLFRRSDKRKWTKEEIDMIINYQAKHGNKFRELANELGTHPWHVKDAYRRYKLRDRKKGHWSQEEYQRLFDLVNVDLQLKVNEEKRSKHGMLRDNISWTAISDKLSTRSHVACDLKWYKQLSSPMVSKGVWADADDYRLISTLYRLDASCMEDVDWDNVVDSRSGDLCRKRWNQMVLHIGHHGNKSFAEQVDVLAQRYCPSLTEAREIWDSKPRVP